MAENLEHDPEKWKPVFPRDKGECVGAEFMPEQGDDILIRLTPIGSGSRAAATPAPTDIGANSTPIRPFHAGTGP
jgi:hypothetical protein